MIKDQMQRERATDLGVVRISNEAIATISAVAALEVRGVHRMGGGLKSTIYEALFSRSTYKGIRIRMRDSEVKLTASIIAEYGADIPRVADEVQENIKRAVEKMAGLVLSEVDVIVEGVHASGSSDKK